MLFKAFLRQAKFHSNSLLSSKVKRNCDIYHLTFNSVDNFQKIYSEKPLFYYQC